MQILPLMSFCSSPASLKPKSLMCLRFLASIVRSISARSVPSPTINRGVSLRVDAASIKVKTPLYLSSLPK